MTCRSLRCTQLRVVRKPCVSVPPRTITTQRRKTMTPKLLEQMEQTADLLRNVNESEGDMVITADYAGELERYVRAAMRSKKEASK
jgi:hypothetical protein